MGYHFLESPHDRQFLWESRRRNIRPQHPWEQMWSMQKNRGAPRFDHEVWFVPFFEGKKTDKEKSTMKTNEVPTLFRS